MKSYTVCNSFLLSPPSSLTPSSSLPPSSLTPPPPLSPRAQTTVWIGTTLCPWFCPRPCHMTVWYSSCGPQVTSSVWHLPTACDDGCGLSSPEYSHVAGEVEGVCGRVRERGCKIAAILVGNSQDNCKVMSLPHCLIPSLHAPGVRSGTWE